MGTPTIFASSFGFGPNYLLNPKTGDKRTFFTTLRGEKPVKDSVPYIINYLPDLMEKPVEQNFVNSGLSKYGTKLNYQVPQMKIPALVGGFVGAKSQSLRDCGKLSDLFASAFSQIISDNMNNLTTCEMLKNSKAVLKEDCSTKMYLSKDTSSINKITRDLNDKTAMSEKATSQIASPLFNKNRREAVNEQASKTLLDNPCVQLIHQEEKGKPPMKKPKLNVQACHLPRRKRKGRRKKCEKNATQCSSPLVSPGYDPYQTSFENIDEVDCGIKLSNRFAPLESETSFHMWSDSPCDLDSSDSPLLDMLSEMHLDDFEIEFDNASPAVDVYNVHSFESDSPLSCNSSIAFILSGNDDLLASDSEDGSFASTDVDDVQWQSFKAEFEFFQDHIPVQNIVLGTCQLDELQFDADLEVFEDDVFLNDLENQTDNNSKQKLREANLRWNQMVANRSEQRKPTKVCFAPDNCLTSIVYIPSGPEECQARKSSWDQCYMDRCRFEKKVKELEPIISLCLTPQHRKSVFQRLYGSNEQI